MMTDPGFLSWVAGMLLAAGLGLHFWTFVTLRNWWRGNHLCTGGPFHYFRHPMYAAWVTFIAMGVALLFNSWVFLIWAFLLHAIWHLLVKPEERMAEAVFGDEYRRYCARTGRFVPRIRGAWRQGPSTP